jgi:hypothetical protein
MKRKFAMEGVRLSQVTTCLFIFIYIVTKPVHGLCASLRKIGPVNACTHPTHHHIHGD